MTDRLATVVAETPPLPEGRRIPFGWPAVPVPSVGAGAPLHVAFPGADHTGPAVLRFTVACDDRCERTVMATLARDGAVLGSFDVRYADPHQCFDLSLTADQAAAAAADGVLLTTAHGDGPLWIFGGAPAAPGHRVRLLPIETGPAGAPAAAPIGFASVASIQPFGWMEGVVLDALLDTGSAAAAAGHLDQYLRGARLVYEDPRSRPADDGYYGVEATLPVAAIARLRPGHPAVRLAVADWLSRTDADGCVRDAATTAEGCYTVAYPMAVLARRWTSPALGASAARQIWVRRERLVQGHRMHLRRLPDGTHTYASWARAFAWYLLGAVRTARALDRLADTTDLWAEVRRTARIAVEARGDEALWTSYVDRPGTGPETCASAGIAAALALGCASGHLGAEFGAVAAETWRALGPWLTCDGRLAGSSQSNKGGESLQLCGYRVISGVATGLMVQLGAALNRIPS